VSEATGLPRQLVRGWPARWHPPRNQRLSQSRRETHRRRPLPPEAQDVILQAVNVHHSSGPVELQRAALHLGRLLAALTIGSNSGGGVVTQDASAPADVTAWAKASKAKASWSSPH
jgi:hypothetical protein